jgi:hypothetical protein
MDFRSDEVLGASNSSLRDITAASASENMAMVSIAKADSRTIRTFSLIVVIYLPISLVTVSF